MKKSYNRRVPVALALTCVVTLVLTLASGPASAYQFHTVRSGDTLWKISRQYQTSISNIRAINYLWTGTGIRAGQRLKIPAAGERVHVVTAGETLWEIANWYRSSVSAIRQANELKANVIRPGQALIIPAAASGPAAPQTAPAQTQTGARVSISSQDQDLLARLVMSEAWSEPYEGKVAVAAVALNRVRSSLFPGTLREVVYQRHQFEPVGNGWINIQPSAESRKAVVDALNGWDPSLGALYFYNRVKSNHPFFKNLSLTVRIGNHWFYH